MSKFTHKEMQMIHISEKYPHREDDQVRDVVYNVYTYLKNESEEFQNAKEGYFTDVITRVSEATGVSPSYVSDVVNGYATVGPEAFLKYSLETPQPVSKKDRKESCDSIPEDVKTPQKKRRKKGSRAPWGKRKKSDGQKEVLKLMNPWKYEIPIDDSNKSFKIDDRSLNELHSTHNFNKISENSKTKISIKNEPSFDIDIVENPLPNIYDQIEESENGHLVNVKQENAPLNNEDLPIPVALFSNQITDKKDPNDNKEEVENEILTGI